MGVEEHEDDASAAVGQVYARASRPLIGLLTVLGGSPSDAEEVAQDAFVRLLEHWATVKEYDDVDAWLRTVAVRLLISRHRRRSVARLGLQRLAARPVVDVSDADLDRLELQAALAGLSLGHRAVLLLHHVHDLSVDEVAIVLRIPVGTVKSRLARARAALAPALTRRSTP